MLTHINRFLLNWVIIIITMKSKNYILFKLIKEFVCTYKNQAFKYIWLRNNKNHIRIGKFILAWTSSIIGLKDSFGSYNTNKSQTNRNFAVNPNPLRTPARKTQHNGQTTFVVCCIVFNAFSIFSPRSLDAGVFINLGAYCNCVAITIQRKLIKDRAGPLRNGSPPLLSRFRRDGHLMYTYNVFTQHPHTLHAVLIYLPHCHTGYWCLQCRGWVTKYKNKSYNLLWRIGSAYGRKVKWTNRR